MKTGIRRKLITSLFPLLLFPFIGLTASITTSKILTETWVIWLLLALFIIFAIIFISIVSSNILKPLRELVSATEKIANGEFDFTLSYDKEDEMRDLCIAFDTMRIQLKNSMEKQAQLEQSQKELIASISHDLRTPMSSIKGYVEGLQDGIVHDKEKFNRYISVIKNKTENLDTLIESLFLYSRIDISGYRKESLSIRESAELLESILSPIELEFTDQPILLEVVKPLPSVNIRVDEKTLSQVFDNLISNAKRYINEDGKIRIETSIENSSLKVSINDNGIGIEKKDIEHIFEQFYRAEKSRSSNFGGAGIGLAICKKVIENHGGKIWVESEVDVGTTFYFTIPTVS